MNPFIIEDVAPNRLVSEYVNQTRYSGGVAGLGQCLPARRRARGLGAVSLQLMRKEWHGKCPSGSSPGPIAASGNQYCIPDASAQAGYKLSDKDDEVVVSGGGGSSSGSGYSAPPLVSAGNPSEWTSWPGSKTEESGGGGGGFFSSIMDAAGKMFTGAAQPRQGDGEPPPEKKSSPWPWIVGGVAVLGLGAFVLTRSKR